MDTTHQEAAGIDSQIRELISNKVAVWINHNNDTGDWQYSVQVAEGFDKGFWLDSFGTKEEAEEFIKLHELRDVSKNYK